MIPIQFSKEAFKYLVCILLFILLWFLGCSGPEKSTVTEKVILPEVKGVFKAKKPVHEPLNFPKNDKSKNDKSKIGKVENPNDKDLANENERIKQYIAENEKLKLSFAKEMDSLKKQLLFDKVVQLNKFSIPFEDENIKIDMNGIVQGEVKEITPSYTVKKKTFEVPVKEKETVFRLLGGLEVGNNTKLDAFTVKANLMFQNGKGDVISGSFDTNKTIWFGYNFSIFNIKK